MPKRFAGTDDSPAQWPLRTLAPELLLPLHEVNERCLDLIALVAKLPAEDAPFALVMQQRLQPSQQDRIQ